MTKAFSEAVARRPPRGNGTGEMGEAFAAAGGATPVPLPMPVNGSGAWWTFKPAANGNIRFGRANVAAATASDYPLAAGIPEEWWCEAGEDSHFCSSGAVIFYRSSR